MPNVIGFIPARGGSKAIPRKNLHMLNGKPLLSYTIEAALKSAVCNRVIVSSEDEEILEVAQKYNAEADPRPIDLAQDSSTLDEVLVEFIQRRKLNLDDIIIVLQPTSPLRDEKHLLDAYHWYVENAAHQSHAQVLMSVYQVDSKALYAYCEDGSFMKPVCEWASSLQVRQSLPNVYLPNRAIYIFSVGAFLLENRIPKHHIVPFVMTEEESVDIDTEEDLRRCSYYLMGLPERRAK